MTGDEYNGKEVNTGNCLKMIDVTILGVSDCYRTYL